MIKSTFFTLCISLLSIALIAGDTVTKKVSTTESSIQWTAKKVTGQHTGTIGIKDGVLEFDGDNLVGGEFTIAMNTLEVQDLQPGKGKEKLEGHLSSADFFAITAHPTAHMKFLSVKRNTDGDYSINGDLTIKGITNPIEFTASVDGNTATADITVDRTLYDVKYGSTKFGALADKAIYDDFSLSVTLSYGEITVKSIDAESSTIEWTARKVGGEHHGTISVSEGEIQFANGSPIGGSFTIDMTSLTVTDLKPGKGKEKLEGHLSSDDFFSIATNPTATFVIQEVEANGDMGYLFIGDLTLKGITNPLSFAATMHEGGASAEISVDRTLYNVKYGSTKFGALADKAIYDNFDLKVNLAL